MTRQPVGTLVRTWRERRHRSQLDVAVAADVSSRHLSFIETGRATPSRLMIARICEELDVPLRERNEVYLSAGYAPVHPERPLEDLGAARAAVDAVLSGHEPYPTAVVNVRWELLAANRAMRRFLDPLPDSLRKPKINMLRASLHPDGLAGQLRNYAHWRDHTVRRVRRQRERTADPELTALCEEIEGYPVPDGSDEDAAHGSAVGQPDSPDSDLLAPMVLDTPFGTLSLFYVLSVFGAPRDVTLDEIALETMFPADGHTREVLFALAEHDDRDPQHVDGAKRQSFGSASP
ncbi:helix-turn-helix domain-containing protein [Microbacterium sp. JB110]|uniref:helix-turn-helix domain-containing protein n=1 Tax=Microbacterium sp. JB110 TaxID=2024477 RepID=UPI000B35899F|nr:helix-turn-helix transcriptional regulator [Microbacterium sp. JB110]RCS63080.1 XRE family transcriptional regulator [Microbacterium sp. JB110]